MKRTITLFILSIPFTACGAHDEGVTPLECGDGVVQFETGESCDDGNNDDGDGCSSQCALEGCVWPAPCQPCGNGTVDGPIEECDDGNNDDGDGCSATCDLESESPDTCGDGLLQPEEFCDDGNSLGADGCSEVCTVEAGYSCHVPGEPCEANTCDVPGSVCAACGDGVLQPGETCDDANSVGSDGCSDTCEVEPNFGCFVPGEPCTPTMPL